MPELGKIDSCEKRSEDQVQSSNSERTLPRSQVQTMVRNWYLKGCPNQGRLRVANSIIAIVKSISISERVSLDLRVAVFSNENQSTQEKT